MWEAELDEGEPEGVGSKLGDFPLAEPMRPSLVKESMAVLTILMMLALNSASLLSMLSWMDSVTSEVEGGELIDQPSPMNSVLHR